MAASAPQNIHYITIGYSNQISNSYRHQALLCILLSWLSIFISFSALLILNFVSSPTSFLIFGRSSTILLHRGQLSKSISSSYSSFTSYLISPYSLSSRFTFSRLRSRSSSTCLRVCLNSAVSALISLRSEQMNS